MELSRFDQIAREIGAGIPRRSLLGWLIAFLLGGLLSPWRGQETAGGAGRRKRRKTRHKHGRQSLRRKRQRRKLQRRKRRKKGSTCQPGQPCAEPGQICQRDGSCACTSASCPECQTCDAGRGLCVPNPDTAGDPCGEPIQVCQPDGTCACPGGVCGGVCGCEDGFICDRGTCQPCDVVFNGDSVASGTDLQNKLHDPGGTLRVCPGRYQHTFALSANVTLIGAGDGADPASSTILDAGGSGRTLLVDPGVTASLRGVRISGGDEELGGGVRNNGELTLTACTISGNSARLGGGAYNGGGLTLTNCTFSGNAANLGGAIYYSNDATGSLAVIDCRLTDNDAIRGAGLDNNGISTVTISGSAITKNRSAQDGAGIYNNGGIVAITSSQISENEAQANGGGIYIGRPVLDSPGEVTFDAASRVEHNTAGADGGGIYNRGEVALAGAIVTGNTPNNCAGDPVTGCIEEP